VKIYVASSWRNEHQPEVVKALREHGHDVYDFRNSAPDFYHSCFLEERGFHWSQIDPNWQSWTPKQFIEALTNEVAVRGFQFDYNAMHSADACVLVQPCGISAHLEAGWFVGQGKPLYVLLAKGEPELMYKMATGIFVGLENLLASLTPAVTQA